MQMEILTDKDKQIDSLMNKQTGRQKEVKSVLERKMSR